MTDTHDDDKITADELDRLASLLSRLARCLRGEETDWTGYGLPRIVSREMQATLPKIGIDAMLPTTERIADDPGQWVETFADLLSAAAGTAWHGDRFCTAEFLDAAANRLRDTQ